MTLFYASFGALQKIGKSLMLPVSVLPIAGLFLGLGNAELEWVPEALSHTMQAAGSAVFENIPLLFAIGVALGFTENDGVAALAAAVGYAVMIATMGVLAESAGLETTLIMGMATINTGVMGGILIGVMTAYLFNQFYRIHFPSYFGFFAGKRFVPIITAYSAMALGAGLLMIWPPVGFAIDSFSEWAAVQNPTLAFTLYGLVERALIPFGLHHIWNVPFFFETGSYTLASGQVVTGELQRYLQGDPAAGNLAGGYLFKMWGLPAAAIAIWHSASPEHRVKVGGIMLTAALTSFITGITEPIEFTFIFAAPVLYVVHAILAGIAFPLCIELGIKHGMSFSQGVLDFSLFYHLGQNQWLFFILGPLYALIYYASFRILITTFNLKTPGRDQTQLTQSPSSKDAPQQLAIPLITAFGGAQNIATLDACITRLRIGVKETSLVDTDQLRALGAVGVVQVGHNMQAIFGTQSENLKTAMKLHLKNRPAEIKQHKPTPISNSTMTASLNPEILSAVEQCITAFGGTQNIQQATQCANSRIRLLIRTPISAEKWNTPLPFIQTIMPIRDDLFHLLIGDQALNYAAALQHLRGKNQQDVQANPADYHAPG